MPARARSARTNDPPWVCNTRYLVRMLDLCQELAREPAHQRPTTTRSPTSRALNSFFQLQPTTLLPATVFYCSLLLVSILHYWLDLWILGRLPTTSDDITIYGTAMQLSTLLIHSSPAHSSNHTVHAPHSHDSFPMPVFQPLRKGMFHSPPCALALASLFIYSSLIAVLHVCLHRCGRLSCNGNIVSGRMGRMGSDLNPNHLSVFISFL